MADIDNYLTSLAVCTSHSFSQEEIASRLVYEVLLVNIASSGNGFVLHDSMDDNSCRGML